MRQSPILNGGLLHYRQKFWFGLQIFRKGHAIVVFVRSLEDVEEVFSRYFISDNVTEIDERCRSSRVYGHLANALVDKSPILIISPLQKKTGKLSMTSSEFIPLSSCRRLLNETDDLGACQFGLVRSLESQPDSTFVFKASSTKEYKEWLTCLRRNLRLAKRSSRVTIPLPTNFPPVRYANQGPDIDSASETSSRQLSIISRKAPLRWALKSRIAETNPPASRKLGILRPIMPRPSMVYDFNTDTECGSMVGRLSEDSARFSFDSQARPSLRHHHHPPRLELQYPLGGLGGIVSDLFDAAHSGLVETMLKK
ncbi:hypothetical protein HDU67_001159 [Dinochytrium kinnereticum]|nr:hypothetical protein HDU67_001159 [Dinochytrium kinnereticum]